MGEGRGAGQRQEEYVCVEIEDRLGAPTSAEQLVACPREDLTTHCEPSPPNAFMSVPECRICQEEDHLSQLETPCDCSGTLKYAHRKCVQRWCDEKGDTICEICHQPYKHGYSVSQLQLRAGNVSLDLSDTWGMELRDPRILALAAAQRRFLESDYEEFTAVNSGSAACCRSVALIRAYSHFTNIFRVADFPSTGGWIFTSLLHIGPCYEHATTGPARADAGCSNDSSGGECLASSKAPTRHSGCTGARS